MCVILITQLLRLVIRLGSRKWVAVVTPTDRPKSVRNCLVFSCFLAVSVGVMAFVIRPRNFVENPDANLQQQACATFKIYLIEISIDVLPFQSR